MSASPAQPPSGPNSVTPTSGGPPAPIQRKKAPVNIFNSKKKLTKRPLQPAHKSFAPSRQPNGVPPHASQQTAQPAANGIRARPVALLDDPSTYTDYPITISRSSFNRGLHHHALRFHSKSEVNPYDEKQFVRPVRLHRRYAGEKVETAEQSDAASGVDDKEKEIVAARRAEREAEREANKALIAPTGDAGKKLVKRKQQKKVEDVYYDENNPRQRAKAQFRYEEARPWHLEDDDAKNAWVGSYEQPLSENSVMFVVDGPGFTMIPVEKWYKMQSANRLDSKADSELIEKQMSAKFKTPRWALNTQVQNDLQRREAPERRRGRQQTPKARRGDESDGEVPFVKNEDFEYRADVDEIDFEYNDEFQDDDEGFVFGEAGDDEAKEIEKKIRLEMREANLAGTGVKDEDKDWDEEEQEEKNAELERKQKEKRMRKQLRKKEARQEYASDDSIDNKYESSSESEDSEDERDRLEEERKKEEGRKVNGDKSGASTIGTNTPTGRPEKRPSTNLKRDADFSELSGNESSRKKAKTDGHAMSASVTNGARSLSPDAAKHRVPRTGTGDAGSGSDTDTSRAGRLKLKNSRPGSASGNRSPNGSRAGSPPGSRAQSPGRGGVPAAKSASNLPFPSLEEVRLAIPSQGIVLSDLVKLFKERVAGRGPEFIPLVKQVARQDPETKKLVPKPPEA